jgi:hypothetical protein
MEMETPGMTAPCASVIVPDNDAPETCAQTGTVIASRSMRTVKQITGLTALRIIEGLLRGSVRERKKKAAVDRRSDFVMRFHRQSNSNIFTKVAGSVTRAAMASQSIKTKMGEFKKLQETLSLHVLMV